MCTVFIVYGYEHKGASVVFCLLLFKVLTSMYSHPNEICNCTVWKLLKACQNRWLPWSSSASLVWLPHTWMWMLASFLVKPNPFGILFPVVAIYYAPHCALTHSELGEGRWRRVLKTRHLLSWVRTAMAAEFALCHLRNVSEGVLFINLGLI